MRPLYCKICEGCEKGTIGQGRWEKRKPDFGLWTSVLPLALAVRKAFTQPYITPKEMVLE